MKSAYLNTTDTPSEGGCQQPGSAQRVIEQRLNEQSELIHTDELESILDVIEEIDTVTKHERLLDIVNEACVNVEGCTAKT